MKNLMRMLMSLIALLSTTIHGTPPIESNPDAIETAGLRQTQFNSTDIPIMHTDTYFDISDKYKTMPFEELEYTDFQGEEAVRRLLATHALPIRVSVSCSQTTVTISYGSEDTEHYLSMSNKLRRQMDRLLKQTFQGQAIHFYATLFRIDETCILQPDFTSPEGRIFLSPTGWFAREQDEWTNPNVTDETLGAMAEIFNHWLYPPTILLSHEQVQRIREIINMQL